MQQVEEVTPPLTINLNGTLLKTEFMDQPTPTPTPISLTESSVAPPPVISTPPIPRAIAPAQPLLTITPSSTIKRVKKVCIFHVFCIIEYYYLGLSNLFE
jgi:hypothetical protein